MWSCTICGKHNQNKNNKCRKAFCKGEKPEQLVRLEQKTYQKNHVRDFCPKCKSHQDFVKINGKRKYQCTRCKRSFKFRGKPVPEIKKELINNTHIKSIEIPVIKI